MCHCPTAAILLDEVVEIQMVTKDSNSAPDLCDFQISHQGASFFSFQFAFILRIDTQQKPMLKKTYYKACISQALKS